MTYVHVCLLWVGLKRPLLFMLDVGVINSELVSLGLEIVPVDY